MALAAALVAAAGAAGAALAGRPVAARRLLGLAAAGFTGAVAVLAAALLRGDWALVYVADYTSRDTPWPYRLAALWGGMEGSLLVWGWVLSLWGVGAARCAKRRRGGAGAAGAPAAMVAAVVAVPAAVAAVVAGLLLAVVPPFARLEVPAIDGGGLTPVLRHPAMLYHPLLLYAGQVGLVVPFALALGARAGRAPVEEWLPAARRWMLASLAVLAVAVVAGAHWAYVNLGWGGYWAWDPVENAALLPWLAGAAFLHAARRPTSAGAPPARLAALTFGLALGGAILTRSGATGSVHAFAEAATVGAVLAGLLAALTAAAVVVEWRHGREAAGGAGAGGEGGGPYVVAAALLGAVVAVVGAGTVLPLLRGSGSLVDGRYFAVTTLPLGLALLGLAGAGPRWRGRGTPARRFLPALAGAPAAAGAALAGGGPLAVAGAGLGGATAALTMAELVERRRRPAGSASAPARWGRSGGLVAHLGLAVLLTGVLGTTAANRQTGALGPGQVLTVAGYTLRLDGLAPADAEGPGEAVTATVAVERGGQRVATLRPKARLSGAGQRVSVSGLRSTPWEDLQVTLRAIGPAGDGAVVDVAVTPLVQWVWWGGLLVAAGLALSAGNARLTPNGRGVGEGQTTREVQWTR